MRYPEDIGGRQRMAANGSINLTLMSSVVAVVPFHGKGELLEFSEAVRGRSELALDEAFEVRDGYVEWEGASIDERMRTGPPAIVNSTM
jgi:hypothetical protein